MNVNLLNNKPFFESLFLKYKKGILVFPIVLLVFILALEVFLYYEQNKILKELKYEQEIKALTQDKLFLQNQLDKTKDQLTKSQMMLEKTLNHYK